MNVPALERCVGDAGAFLRDHWGRAPLVHRGEGTAFEDLVTLDDLDRLVSSHGLTAASLRMVRDGNTLAPSTYTVSPGTRSRGMDALISPALVYERFSAGATIVLESLHRYWEPLTDLCRDLEMTIGHRLQVNAYVTPPASQGFDIHRDDHDVFVLQISGSKHWSVLAPDVEDKVLIDEEIGPGTTLYIPTGCPHSAETGASASSHLTVGVLTNRASDVLRAVVELAAEEPTFSERLPAAAPNASSLEDIVTRYVDEFRSWLDKVDPTDITERVARRVVPSAQPIMRGQLRQLELVDSIGGDTRVRRRRGATCFLLRKEPVLKVLLADRELEMPSFVEPAMREIATRDHLAVQELHSFLDEEGALVLVRRLIREGLLEVVVGT